jgi:hypothetical protein
MCSPFNRSSRWQLARGGAGRATWRDGLLFRHYGTTELRTSLVRCVDPRDCVQTARHAAGGTIRARSAARSAPSNVTRPRRRWQRVRRVACSRLRDRARGAVASAPHIHPPSKVSQSASCSADESARNTRRHGANAVLSAQRARHAVAGVRRGNSTAPHCEFTPSKVSQSETFFAEVRRLETHASLARTRF